MTLRDMTLVAPQSDWTLLFGLPHAQNCKFASFAVRYSQQTCKCPSVVVTCTCTLALCCWNAHVLLCVDKVHPMMRGSHTVQYQCTLSPFVVIWPRPLPVLPRDVQGKQLATDIATLETLNTAYMQAYRTAVTFVAPDGFTSQYPKTIFVTSMPPGELLARGCMSDAGPQLCMQMSTLMQACLACVRAQNSCMELQQRNMVMHS